jgi:chemotaxis family two-component system sensor kinase Cph1
VTGHGFEAVATMAQLQHLVTGLLRGGAPLDETLSRVNGMLAPDTLATAQLVHIDPRAGRLGYVNAGHPWAMLRCPDGEVQVLSGSANPPLGLMQGDAPLRYVDCRPGSMLLCYTDGLIERRSETITESIDRLAGIFGAVDTDGPIPEIVTEIVERAHGRATGTTTDDIAVLLARIAAPVTAVDT